MSTTTWVDFRELRAKLDFAAVLQHYGVQFKSKKRNQVQAFCPLPGHKGRGDGKKHSPSFSVNLERGCFFCHSCHSSGGAIDFAVLMEGHALRDHDAVRKVALMLQERFIADTSSNQSPKSRSSKASQSTINPNESVDKVGDSGAQQKPSEGQARSVIVNAPLTFSLQKLDNEPLYLKERGFTTETISNFELGYCVRGLMQGRIAIPLHNHHGELIGYAGRIVDDANIDEENPKYLFPGSREREGKEHRFAKSHFLYNGNAVSAPVDDLIVVEGFTSVWWLWQHGYQNVVALMGSSCSVEQAWLIAGLVSHSGRVWIMPDRDDAGERCAHSVLTQVGWQRFCRWIKLDQGQPTDLAADALSKLLEGVVRHN